MNLKDHLIFFSLLKFFEHWIDFDAQLWERLKQTTKEKQQYKNVLPSIIGCEQNLEIAKQAKFNIQAAGLDKVIENKFYCPSKFAQEIERMVQENPELN